MRLTGLLGQSSEIVTQGMGGGAWLENKIFFFTLPHPTNDLFQLEINFDNVYFIYKWYFEVGGG